MAQSTAGTFSTPSRAGGRGAGWLANQSSEPGKTVHGRHWQREIAKKSAPRRPSPGITGGDDLDGLLPRPGSRRDHHGRSGALAVGSATKIGLRPDRDPSGSAHSATPRGASDPSDASCCAIPGPRLRPGQAPNPGSEVGSDLARSIDRRPASDPRSAARAPGRSPWIRS